MIADEFKELYRRLLSCHMLVEENMSDLRDQLQNQPTLGDLADADYAISRCAELADNIKSKVRKLEELSQQIVCLRWMMQDDGEPIRTDHVTCSPRMTTMGRLPSKHKEPEKYEAALKALGVSDEAVKGDLFRVHWPSLVYYMESLAEEGKPLPEGIDYKSTYPVYKCTRRKKKGVLEE